MQFSPVVEEEWWNNHVEYSKLNRQRLDISTAIFRRQNPKAVVVIVTGWSESYLKYAELIRSVYERGFCVFTYDHQSQGLSGRWLAEHTSTWIHTFDDYVEDFIYCVSAMAKTESPNLPIYVIAHSMGGLIVSMAMARLPSLISRCVMTSPMFRSKHAFKIFGCRFPLPQPVALWIAHVACFAGLGTMNALGFPKKESKQPLTSKEHSSDPHQRENWLRLKLKYPEIASTCVTNDWIVQSVRAQSKLARLYGFIGTNTIILCADSSNEVFVYNRAMALFINKSANSRLFTAPEGSHEVLFENDVIRGAAQKTILDFFTQVSNSAQHFVPSTPLVEWDRNKPIFSPLESFVRVVGVTLCMGGLVTGLAMVLSGGKKSNLSVFGY